MSGHSKWHNIRLRKGKADAQRGALFTKLSKEIILAARSGSPDPEGNYRLKMAVEKARESNMPAENIKRAISRAAGGTGERAIEEIRYEGYGPHGIAVILDAATDNRARTAAELRFLFSRHGGSLGETGSVAWMFEPVGIAVVDSQGRSEESLTEMVLLEGVIDLDYGAQSEIYTDPAALARVRDELHAAGVKVTDAYLGARAKTQAAVPPENLQQAIEFLDALEAHEDVQRAFSNLDADEAALEALA